MAYDIITMGSATVDLFVQTQSDLISITTPHSKESLIAYPTGSKILIQSREFHTGGGGTNAAVTLAKMGLRVGFAGCIGDDEHGDLITRELKKENVRMLLPIKKGPSGFSIVLDSIAHDRTILAYKGVNDALTILPPKKLNARWYYCASLMGKSWKTFCRIVPKLKGKIVMNPSSYLVKEERAATLSLLAHLEGIIFNKEEAQLLLQSSEEPKMLLLQLLIHGMNFAIITDGSRGIYAKQGNDYYAIKPRPIKIAESTGAGDAFGSACTGALARGKPFRTALAYGLANAESVIMQRGAKRGILSLAKMQTHHRAYNSEKP